MLEVLSVLVLLVCFAAALKFMFRKEKVDTTPLVATRNELVSYILNKSLDSYESNLTRQLQKASDVELQKIASQISVAEQYSDVTKNRNI
jgi:hypothetical protein